MPHVKTLAALGAPSTPPTLELEWHRQDEHRVALLALEPALKAALSAFSNRTLAPQAQRGWGREEEVSVARDAPRGLRHPSSSESLVAGARDLPFLPYRAPAAARRGR